MPRHDYTQRLARLTKILTLLYHPKSDGSLCAKSLAQEFGVSLRTLRRDVEMMGADFSYERDTIYFLGSKLPKSISQADSFIALALLRSFAYSMNGEIKSQMLSLLNSLESTSAHNAEPFFTRSNLEEIALEPESIARLQKAIKEHKVISFEFLKEPNILSKSPHSRARNTQREVLPLKILNFSGEWYLLGLESSVIKKFYLNSITNICEIRQGEKVSQELLGRLDNALNAWFSPGAKPFMVRLWIDPKIAKYFKRKKISPNQHLDENTDGSLDITLHITSAMEIAPLVLMWIPNVVVLEPKDLREFIQAQTQSYVQRVQEISC